MPQCLERNAIPSGVRHARSHSSAGAVRRREELRDATGTRIELRNRSFGVLRHLATNAGRLVTKDELLEVNWPGVTVTDDSLTQCISEIRRALGDAGRDLVRTVPRRGYMIVAAEQPVTKIEPASSRGRSPDSRAAARA